MLVAGSALKGYAIAASDGGIGTVSDFLFDDRTWKIRWLVVDTGTWLTGRKVLVHPSAIGPADHMRRQLAVTLTKARIEASPELAQDQPVSQRMQRNVYDYYGWDSMWGGSGYFGASSLMMTPGWGASPSLAAPTHHDGELREDEGDPHLRGIAEVAGYHVHAQDGSIGHIENFLIDDIGWGIRYLVIDTMNWWFGQHVLISPYAVKGVSWAEHRIELDITRETVKASPPWNPADAIDESYERHLHGYYNWPGYGW